jgi:hypothetical protein
MFSLRLYRNRYDHFKNANHINTNTHAMFYFLTLHTGMKMVKIQRNIRRSRSARPTPTRRRKSETEGDKEKVWADRHQHEDRLEAYLPVRLAYTAET